VGIAATCINLGTAARDAILKPILQEMWEMRDIAAELTARNLPTPRSGDEWSPMTVMRAMKRLGIAGSPAVRDLCRPAPGEGKICQKACLFLQCRATDAVKC
jgi:hypothetical protein